MDLFSQVVRIDGLILAGGRLDGPIPEGLLIGMTLLKVFKSDVVNGRGVVRFTRGDTAGTSGNFLQVTPLRHTRRRQRHTRCCPRHTR